MALRTIAAGINAAQKEAQREAQVGRVWPVALRARATAVMPAQPPRARAVQVERAAAVALPRARAARVEQGGSTGAKDASQDRAELSDMFAVDAVNSGGASGSGGAQTMEGAPGSGGVVSGCGNAALETDEGCDDGNQADGDGCSHDCKVEDGFICDTVAASQTCQPGTGQCLRLPVIYRDFQPENATSGGHPDFHFLGSKSNGTSYSYTHLHSQPIPLTRHTRRCLSEV